MTDREKRITRDLHFFLPHFLKRCAAGSKCCLVHLLPINALIGEFLSFYLCTTNDYRALSFKLFNEFNFLTSYPTNICLNTESYNPGAPPAGKCPLYSHFQRFRIVSRISANRLEPSEIRPQPENGASRVSESVQNFVVFRKKHPHGATQGQARLEHRNRDDP